MTKCLDRHVIENRNNKRPEWRDRKKLFVHSNVWVAFTGSSANEVRTEWLNNIECVLEEFYGHIWKCSKCKIILYFIHVRVEYINSIEFEYFQNSFTEWKA